MSIAHTNNKSVFLSNTGMAAVRIHDTYSPLPYPKTLIMYAALIVTS